MHRPQSWAHSSALSLVLLLSACAPVRVNIRGELKPRLTLGYSDHRYFAVVHRAAYPEARGASSGLRAYGGRIDGVVCGLDVWLEADYRGSRLQLAGFVSRDDGSSGNLRRALPAHLEVRDSDGARHISGGVGAEIDSFVGMTGTKAADKFTDSDWDIGENGSPFAPVDHRVDIRFDTGSLHGRVARREFDLRSDGKDALAGTVTENGMRYGFVLRGMSHLWSMPAADQAAVLPIMLSCDFGADPERVAVRDGTAELNVDLAQR
jgi:hypothetical protein